MYRDFIKCVSIVERTVHASVRTMGIDVDMSVPAMIAGEKWRVRKMVRDRLGNILAQCAATYTNNNNHVRCVKEKGHDGEHTDARGTWNEATERTSTEEVPADEDGGRDGDLGGGDSS